MKLVRAHIENFGTLSSQDFVFDEDGLSVFQEPNGFGKTTLATFVKAMFYGLVGGGHSVERNERRKYKPWQGGDFGGYLVFDHDGERYRVTRRFGGTKGKDETELTVEATGRKVERLGDASIGDELGEALFGLDAESFEKSVFLPQGKAADYVGDGIGEKLAGILEGSADSGGYDEAVDAIRDVRKVYKPYKGTGGKTAEAAAQITELENELHAKAQDKVLLADAEGRVASLGSELEGLEVRIGEVRAGISAASSAEAARALAERYRRLAGEMAYSEQQVAQLAGLFPKRVPTMEELDGAVALASQVEAGMQAVSDQDATASSREVVAKLEPRFVQGVPAPDALDAAGGQCAQLSSWTAELARVRLTDGERAQLAQLEGAFGSTPPSEEEAAAAQGLMEARSAAQATVAAYQVNIEERAALDRLQGFFKRGVPGLGQLDAMDGKLDDADSLRRRATARLSDGEPGPAGFAVADEAAADGDRRGRGPCIAAAVGAVVLAGVAAALYLAAHLDMPAIICGVAAVVCLVAAVLLRPRGPVPAKRASAVDEALVRQVQEDNRRAEELEEEVRLFVEGYYSDGRALRPALADLRKKASDYEALCEKMQQAEERAQVAQERLAESDGRLRRLLGAFWPADGNLATAFADWSRAAADHRMLLAKQATARDTERQLRAQMDAATAKLRAFLRAYQVEVREGSDFAAALSALRADAASYGQAQRVLGDSRRAEEERRAKLETDRARLAEFLSDVGCEAGLDRAGLVRLRDGRLQLDQAQAHLEVLRQQLATFLEENPQAADGLDGFASVGGAVGDAAEEDSAELDLDALQAQERQLQEQQDALREELHNAKMEQRRLADSVASAAALSDELDDARAVLAEAREEVRLLDLTETFLDRAKESLSRKYLGPVEDAFRRHAEVLFDDVDPFRINESLDVAVDASGTFRESAFLSAGVGDMVGVCMRMALSDVLLGKDEGFVILDDPFVNLDDAHMVQALGLLEDLAQDKQVIYLTCHESRVPAASR